MASYLSVVTGGAQGIGLAIVEALLESGGKVYFLDIDEEIGKKKEKELRLKYGQKNVKFLKCDVRNGNELEGTIRTAKQEMGGLNVLCNNAGFGRPFYDTSRWEEEIDVNLKACIRGCMLALDLMGTDKGGSGGVIVNTASLGGINPVPLFPTYCATKAGVLAFTRSIAPIAISSEVRVNCVCPDATETPQFLRTAPELASALSQEKYAAFMQTMSSGEGEQRRLSSDPQKPEEVAKGVMKILQDKTKTGQALVVSKDLGTYYHTFQ